jgi:hypothetical protein
VLKKSFLGDERNFLGPLMRFARGDVMIFVSALRSVAAVEIAKNQLSRDFRCGSIFDFFNSIGQQSTLGLFPKLQCCANQAMQAR